MADATKPAPGRGPAVEIGAGLFAAGMCVLAVAAHRRELLAFKLAGALAAAAGIAIILAATRRPLALLALTQRRGAGPANLLIFAAVGVAVGFWYRMTQGRELLPASLTLTAASAAAIGLLEEIGYRGFVQGALARWGATAAVLLAALAHTAYKCCLFALPSDPRNAGVNIAVLAAGTLVFGVALGAARQKYNNLLLPCLFHVVFDVVAYGDLASLPWWTR